MCLHFFLFLFGKAFLSECSFRAGYLKWPMLVEFTHTNNRHTISKFWWFNENKRLGTKRNRAIYIKVLDDIYSIEKRYSVCTTSWYIYTMLEHNGIIWKAYPYLGILGPRLKRADWSVGQSNAVTWSSFFHLYSYVQCFAFALGTKSYDPLFSNLWIYRK